MHIKEALLSKRFNYTGKTKGHLKCNIKEAVEAIRDALSAGVLERDTFQICPLCKCDEAVMISLQDHLGLPVNALVCEKCGLVFLESYLSERSTSLYYGKYYYSVVNRGGDPKEVFKNRIDPGAYCWKRYDWIKDKLRDEFSKIKVVVEIGSSDGCNLYPYFKNGCKVFGCDFDEVKMNAGREVGMTLLSGGVEVLQKLKIKADLVIISHTLQLLPDIDKALKSAISLLPPDGKIYIEVPGIKSGQDLLSQLRLEHNYYFEFRTLRQFALRNGLGPIAGDEYIRAVFKPAKKINLPFDNNGRQIYGYLKEKEKRWANKNLLWEKAINKAKQLIFQGGK